jgi:endoglucanase
MRKLFLTLFVCSAASSVLTAQEASDKIRLNQIGFYPDAPKVAVVPGENSSDFYVISAGNGDVVFRSKLSELHKSSFSPKVTRIADFSAITKPGTYKLKLPEQGDSYTFEIRPNVFCYLTKGLIKGFYFQRMSTPLLPQFAGKWSRKEGHPDDKVIIHPSAASPGRPEGSLISCPKGWYDAGDYNKYMVNSGITMGTLLSLYEDFPAYFDTLNLNIPESANKIPDLLDEILWNLRWMLTMQDPYDGGVYNKVTNASFDAMVMPSEATKPRYVVQKGTAATLDFASVTAQAGRIFKKFSKVLPGLSDSCVSASKRAWAWAMKNPKMAYNQNAMNKTFKPEISTGGYGDNNFSDEFIWAAAELYITTNDGNYYKSVKMFPDTLMPIPSWGNVRLLGYYTLLRFEKNLSSVTKSDLPLLKSRLVKTADKLINGVSERSYMTVMGSTARDFNWGSNSSAANQGILLIQVYRLTKDRKYLDYALTNLDYLLGRNATGYSFVTGFGKKTPMSPHHRQSESDGIADPVPGLLVGGPNTGKQDGCKYSSDIPDEVYLDSVCSYASNEIAINWNAPAAYLAGAMEAITSLKNK